MSQLQQIEQAVREPLLNPVDRVSEMIFGLFMALTFVGVVSMASAGPGAWLMRSCIWCAPSPIAADWSR
jgi:hypothetical protein